MKLFLFLFLLLACQANVLEDALKSLEEIENPLSHYFGYNSGSSKPDTTPRRRRRRRRRVYLSPTVISPDPLDTTDYVNMGSGLCASADGKIITSVGKGLATKGHLIDQDLSCKIACSMIEECIGYGNGDQNFRDPAHYNNLQTGAKCRLYGKLSSIPGFEEEDAGNVKESPSDIKGSTDITDKEHKTMGYTCFKKIAKATTVGLAMGSLNLGGNGCEEYFTATECEDLANDSKSAWSGVHSMSNFPKGCYWKTDTDDIYFNTHATGRGQSKSRPVCKQTTYKGGAKEPSTVSSCGSSQTKIYTSNGGSLCKDERQIDWDKEPCTTLRPSGNGHGYGCRGAVWSGATTSEKYCKSAWYNRCCTYNEDFDVCHPKVDCRVWPKRVQPKLGENFEQGPCRYAVYSNGDENNDMCDGGSGQYMWFNKCCTKYGTIGLQKQCRAPERRSCGYAGCVTRNADRYLFPRTEGKTYYWN